MKKSVQILLFISIIGFTAKNLSAQSYTNLDTIYTPAGFELGDLWATLSIPANPNGVGVVVTHGATLAAHGYLAMTIDYYSLVTIPGPTVDTIAAYPRQARTFKIAVEFLRRNASQFNLFTDQIVGFGMSGGAYHWGQSIIWDNDDDFFQTDPTINDHVDAAVLLYGPYDNFNFYPSWWEAVMVNHFGLSPTYRATKGNCIANVARITTPVILLHGTNDINVYYQQSVQFHDSLTALGKTSRFVSFPGLAHGFDLTSYFPPHSFTPAGLVARDSILAFLEQVLQPTSIAGDEQEGIVEGFYLAQNYPNPFNPSTNIRFRLPAGASQAGIAGFGFVELKIYDVSGREVATLMSENLAPGEYNLQWNGRDAFGNQLTSGVYFYRLTAGAFTQTRKMILMK